MLLHHRGPRGLTIFNTLGGPSSTAANSFPTLLQASPRPFSLPDFQCRWWRPGGEEDFSRTCTTWHHERMNERDQPVLPARMPTCKRLGSRYRSRPHARLDEVQESGCASGEARGKRPRRVTGPVLRIARLERGLNQLQARSASPYHPPKQAKGDVHPPPIGISFEVSESPANPTSPRISGIAQKILAISLFSLLKAVELFVHVLEDFHAKAILAQTKSFLQGERLRRQRGTSPLQTRYRRSCLSVSRLLEGL